MAVVFKCSRCDYEAAVRWTGRCPIEPWHKDGEWYEGGGCGRNYNIVVKGHAEEDKAKTFASMASLKPPERISTGIPELDKVLGGGGLVKSSIVLLSGPPGIGKTTLLMVASDRVATGKQSVLYTSGEQNTDDIGMTAQRLGLSNPMVFPLGNEGDVYKIVDIAEERKPTMLVIDSLQTAFMSDVDGDVGSHAQCKAVANYLTSFAKELKIPIVITSHVKSDGDTAGGMGAQHLVDTLIMFDRFYEYDEFDEQTADSKSIRVLSSGKNRYGAEGVEERLEMTATGLNSVKRRSYLDLGL